MINMISGPKLFHHISLFLAQFLRSSIVRLFEVELYSHTWKYRLPTIKFNKTFGSHYGGQ